jgi:hypothetical protein
MKRDQFPVVGYQFKVIVKINELLTAGGASSHNVWAPM